MPTDAPPVPREALPPGWGPADICGDQFVYSRRQPTIELIATRGAADQSHPSLGLGPSWELQYRHYVGELSVTESIGHVSTRSAAVTGLLTCMHHIHEEVDTPGDPIEIQAALEDVNILDTLPEKSPRSNTVLQRQYSQSN